MASLNEWTTRGWLQVVATVITVVAVLVAGAAGSGTAAGEILVYGSIGLMLARYVEQRRRRFLLMFDLDDAQAARFQRLQAVLGELAVSGSLRGVIQVGHHGDWKRNGGATRSLSFEAAMLRQTTPPHIVTNVVPWVLSTQGLQLYFFPDRVLIRSRGRFGALSYDQLDVTSDQARFVWDQALPHDARVVGATWLYVRRDGGADGRFNNNRKIPLVLIASVTLRSPTGLDIVVQTTGLIAAEQLSSESHAYRGVASIRAHRTPPRALAAPLATALAALGLGELPTLASLKQTYRELVARNQSEKLSRASREMQVFAGQRVAELSAAYGVVLAHMGGGPVSGERAPVPLSPAVEPPRWANAERVASIAAMATVLLLFAGFRSARHATSSTAPAHVQSSTAPAEVPPVRTASAATRRVVIACPLREQPSPAAHVLTGIAAGTELELLEQHAGWRRVRDPDGNEGWTGPKCWQAPASKPTRTAPTRPHAAAPPKPAPAAAAVEATSSEAAMPIDPYAEDPPSVPAPANNQQTLPTPDSCPRPRARPTRPTVHPPGPRVNVDAVGPPGVDRSRDRGDAAALLDAGLDEKRAVIAGMLRLVPPVPGGTRGGTTVGPTRRWAEVMGGPDFSTRNLRDGDGVWSHLEAFRAVFGPRRWDQGSEIGPNAS